MMSTISAPNPSSKPMLVPSVEKARQLVLSELPSLWPAVHACLATVASLRLSDLELCTTCVLTGPSGVGKSTVTDLLSNAALGAVRVDSITPACFVSSSANSTVSALQRQDLLPQIAGQAMFTRDLSTVFRKNNDQLRELFGVLIPILDGKGYAPSTGTHGLRSVTGRIIFSWIAATVPLPPQTWRVQKRFGSRMLHFDMFKPPAQTDDEILRQRQGKPFAARVLACEFPLYTVMAAIFARRPDGISKGAQFSVDWGTDPDDVALWRVRLARFLVNCRQERGNVDEDDLDDPMRVISQLEAVTRGSAMLDDRTSVTEEDLPLAAQLVLSSSRHGRVLRALAQAPDDYLSAKECSRITGWSEQTSRNRMEEVVRSTDSAIVKWVDPRLVVTGRGRPTEKVLVPADPWLWLADLKRYGWI